MVRIKLLNEIREHSSKGIPAGWFIRTTSYVSGFIKRDLLLCTPGTEVRVPISKDFVLTTPAFIHDIPANESVANVELRAVDPNLNFEVTSFTTTKGEKKTTLPYIKMVDAKPEDPAYLFCLGLNTEPGFSIVSIETEACLVRDYIDKNRSFAALVLSLKNSDQNMSVTVTVSSKTQNRTIVSTYVLDKFSDTIQKTEEEFDGFVETKFISFPNRLIKRRPRPQANQNPQAEKAAAPANDGPRKTIKKNKMNKKKK